MYFKGQGGRKKGGKNKRTDLFAMCEEKKISVFSELLELAMNEAVPDKRFSKFKVLAEYLYAKPKDQGEQELTADDVREWIRQANATGNEGTA